MPKPTASAGGTNLEPENIPAELLRRRQWVTWRLEQRGDRATKVPYTPGANTKAKANDGETWGASEASLADVREGRRDGIGFVFSSGDPYTGIDLDKCRDPETGKVEPWARAIVEALDGYTEVSPSGRGLHVIVRGKLPGDRRRKGRVEAYDSERYFTTTGARP